jgi:hypothetical protein
MRLATLVCTLCFESTMRVPLIIALSACGRSDLAPLVVEASDAPDDTLTAVDSAIDSRPAPPRCSGTWSFAPSVGYFTGAKYAQVPAGIAVGDFNHDGALDIAAVNYDNSIGILINAGNGTFDRPVTYVEAIGRKREPVIGQCAGLPRPNS